MKCRIHIVQNNLGKAAPASATSQQSPATSRQHFCVSVILFCSIPGSSLSNNSSDIETFQGRIRFLLLRRQKVSEKLKDHRFVKINLCDHISDCLDGYRLRVRLGLEFCIFLNEFVTELLRHSRSVENASWLYIRSS